jgi:hypothetical protein
MRVGLYGEDCLNWHTAISLSVLFHHNCERVIHWVRFPRQPASNFFRVLVIAGASVGVARIDLIEFVMESLRIVHLAVQTA